MATRGLLRGADGRTRCAWAGADPLYLRYHDEEWGVPVHDDQRLYEKLCLEGFQAGLSWITVLRKREHFRAAFAGFDFARVARFTPARVERLLGDANLIRHRGKLESAVNNARRALALREEFGSLDAYFWRWAPPPRRASRQAHSPASRALSADLKRRGWTFVGPTTVYAFMQAMGMVNDHPPGCFRRAEVAALRAPGG